MEIHAPGGHAPMTIKEALVHLSIVTVGILIALSLEGALTWSEHRTLVRETQERLHEELVSNQKSIGVVLKSLGPVKLRFIRALEVTSDVSTPDNAKEAAALFNTTGTNVASGMSFAFFNTAAYSTAQVTGALGLMEYSDVVKYADAYDLQNLYTRMQDDTEKAFVAAGMIGTSMAGKPTPTEIEDTKRQLRLALGGLILVENLAKDLDVRYSRVLGAAE